MRHVAEGLVAFLLERHDHGKPILRAASRELLSSCVLRSIMTFFTPFTANKARLRSPWLTHRCQRRGMRVLLLLIPPLAPWG